MKQQILSIIGLVILSLTSYAQVEQHKVIISDELEIVQLSENAYLHVSYQTVAPYGRFSSNGLIYINKKEAMIMDTPPTEALTQELLSWFSKNFPDIKIQGVIVNHFHADCLGGLNKFHELGIKSYAYKLTPELINKDTIPVPQITFNKTLKLKMGDKHIVCSYFGEAHSKDNIVVWIPDERILFGGCMVKSMNAGKGNLSDANISEWSNTVERIKNKFKTAKVVIPDHGNYGGTELLDYTIKLFATEEY